MRLASASLTNSCFPVSQVSLRPSSKAIYAAWQVMCELQARSALARGCDLVLMHQKEIQSLQTQHQYDKTIIQNKHQREQTMNSQYHQSNNQTQGGGGKKKH